MNTPTPDVYNAGHRDGIRAAANLLADDYNDRADLLRGEARLAMRDAATVASNVATNAPSGSAPARGEWPIYSPAQGLCARFEALADDLDYYAGKSEPAEYATGLREAVDKIRAVIAGRDPHEDEQ